MKTSIELRKIIKSLVVPAFILGFALATWLLFGNRSRLKAVHPSFTKLSTPIAQPLTGRNWETLALHFRSDVSFVPNFGKPDFIFAAGSNAIVGGDNYRLAVLGPSGVIRTFDIPLEALRLSSLPFTGIDASSDGTIWISGPNGHPVAFNNEGAISSTLSGSTRAFKIVTLDDGLILMTPPSSKELFEYYSFKEQKVTFKFGEFWKEQDRYGLDLNGMIAKDDSHLGFVYMPAYGGFIASFDSRGQRRFIVEPVQPIQPPTILASASHHEQRHLERKPEYIDSLSVANGYIYVVTKNSEMTERPSTVDVYRVKDGLYVASFSLPNSIVQATFAGDFLYAIASDHVIIWDGLARWSRLHDKSA